MRKILFTSVVALCGLFGLQSCSLDNYEAPGASLTGTIIDSETGKSVPCQSQNGARIRIYEFYKGDWAKQPNDFYTRQDGTFTNNAIFAGKYRIEAEGAFETPEKVELEISGNTTLDLKVVPFLRLTATATATGKTVSMTGTVKKVSAKREISNLEFFCAKTPYVDKSNSAKKVAIDLKGLTDEQIEAETHTASFDNLVSGQTYYFRVGALGKNSANQYNYSEVIEVKIP